MPFILTPALGSNLLAALVDSMKASRVYEVPCKKARKRTDLFKPVISAPNPGFAHAPLRLPITLSATPDGYVQKGTLQRGSTAVRYFRAAEGAGEFAYGGNNVDFAGGTVTVYAEGAAASDNVSVKLTLTGDRTTGTAEAKLESKEINLVTPKVDVEYKAVLVQRDEHDDFPSDPTYIEVWIEQTNKAYPFKQGAKISCTPANAEVYLDKECTKEVKAITSKQLTATAKHKLYLKGVAEGEFELTIELDKPGDMRVRRAEKPAKEKMAAVKLDMKVHQHDATALAALEVDPDTDPIDDYYKDLKDETLPDQKEMTDAQKTGAGRLLHLQSGGHFGRARVVLPKLDAKAWPDYTDVYKLVLQKTGKGGDLAIYDAEFDGAAVSPAEFTVASLKTAAKTVWIQGAAESKKAGDVQLALALDRAAGGLAKTPKAYGDWARFTVVQIKEVKVDYTAPKDEASAWDAAKERFYINLKTGTDGRKVTIGAQLSPKLEGIAIYFMLAPDKDNRKKANWGEDMPAAWKWKKITSDVKHLDRASWEKVLHLSDTTDANGYAKKELVLSRIGGDKFHPACYLDQDPHLAKYVHGYADLEKRKPVFAAKDIIVWRKFWCQVMKVEGRTWPALTKAADKYTLVKASMEICTDVEVESDDVKKMDPPAVYKRYMVILNGGNSDAVVVTDNNKASFFDDFETEDDKPIKIPILICDAQWDDGGITSEIDVPKTEPSKFPVDVTVDKLVLDPPLVKDEELFQAGRWHAAEWDASANSGAGAWVNLREGDLEAGDISVNSGRKNLKDVTVALPSGVGATTNKTKVWITGLKVRGAKGPYLGEYSKTTKKILAVYDPTEQEDFQNTIAHELGHAFHQVIDVPATGVKTHPNRYYSQGYHCNKSTNKCLMYQSGPITGSLNKYCEVCHPYVLVQDMAELA